MCINVSVISQNYSGEIKYGQEVIKIFDTTSIAQNDLKDVLLEKFFARQKALAPDENYYTLKFDKDKSVFTTLNMMDSDGKNKVFRELTKGTYYTNITDKTVYRKSNFIGENLILFYNKLPYEEWQIKNEKKIIRGYNCIKAETIRRNEKGVKTKVIAWFTTDINLNFGPKNYFGLPGLIIELHELDSVYYVREIKFKKVTVDEMDTNNRKIITYDDYVKKVNGRLESSFKLKN